MWKQAFWYLGYLESISAIYCVGKLEKVKIKKLRHTHTQKQTQMAIVFSIFFFCMTFLCSRMKFTYSLGNNFILMCL